MNGWAKINPNFPAGLFEEAPVAFMKGDCRVLMSRERYTERGPAKLHLSISCADRYPTWEEIKDARYSLLPPSRTFAQLLPPLGEYVNIHQNCFHLWEVDP